MRDGEDGDFAFEFEDGGGDAFFGFVVEGARCLVEDENGRLLVEGAGDADALALAAAELDAAFADGGSDAVFLLADEVVELSHLERPPDAPIVDRVRRHTEGDVLTDCAVDEVDGLRHVGDVRLPGTHGGLDVDAVDSDAATRRREQAEQEVDERRLPRARGADDADEFSLGDGEAHVAQHVLAAGVVEAEMLDADCLAEGKRRGVLGNGKARMRELALLDGEEFAVELVEKGHLELDTITETNDAVRARHEAKRRERENAEQWYDSRGRLPQCELADDEQE